MVLLVPMAPMAPAACLEGVGWMVVGMAGGVARAWVVAWVMAAWAGLLVPPAVQGLLALLPKHMGA